MNAALAFYGFDKNYNIAFWMTLIFTVLDAALITISFRPFRDFYNMKKAERDYEANLMIDENGCDQYGNDHYGVPCPKPDS